MLLIHPHLLAHVSFVIVYVVLALIGVLGQTGIGGGGGGGFGGLTGSLSNDPLGAILMLMNTMGSFFTTEQQQQMQQEAWQNQLNSMRFAQDPQKMNQLIGALGAPYSFGTLATGGMGGQANQLYGQFNTPYAQMLAKQDPSQMNSLIGQYTQGLNSALTSNVANAVQSQLAGSGMTQAPGVQTYALAQALAPTEQQNVALGAQLAQAPIEYGLREQQYGLAAAGLPLQYTLQQEQLASNLAQNALQYPFMLGEGIAGQFPNYQFGAGG